MTLIILLLGLGVGVLVGLLGIGGGVVLVPAMVYLLSMDQHLAQGTSLFILLPPIGLGALREYWKQGQVDLRAGILCAVGMLFGAFAGSLVALPMPSRNLKGLFGCFLVLSAILLWDWAWWGFSCSLGWKPPAPLPEWIAINTLTFVLILAAYFGCEDILGWQPVTAESVAMIPVLVLSVVDLMEMSRGDTWIADAVARVLSRHS